MVRHGESFGSSGMCPHKRGFCNSGGWIRGVPLYHPWSAGLWKLHCTMAVNRYTYVRCTGILAF